VLHYISIHADGHAWLKKLAECYGGTFHDTKLSLDDTDDDEVQIISALPFPATATGAGTVNHPISLLDDDDVQLVAFKSADTARRERFEVAASAGQVISVGSTTMRSTFRAISTSLTSMRSSDARHAERNVTLESASGGPSVQSEFMATRMVLDAPQSKFEVPPGEKPNERRVCISAQPFAQGGLRNVYAMTELPRFSYELPKQLVAKESRHVISFAERLKFHKETSICQARAAQLARSFNQRGAKVGVPAINFLRTDVYRVLDEKNPGGYRYLAVEARLTGKYEKYNSNNGFVLRNGEKANSSERVTDLPQAFSHFTFEMTGGKEMVVDIQGTPIKYTDPQLHSTTCSYGRADRGVKGFADFFASHECNSCCRALGLSLQDAAQFNVAA